MKLPDWLKRSRPTYVLIVLPDQHKCLECSRDSAWRRFWRAVGAGARFVVALPRGVWRFRGLERLAGWCTVLATLLTILALFL